jgi:hypothetical protein
MGIGFAKSFTEEGVQRLYQFFLIQILFIFFSLLSIALVFVGVSDVSSLFTIAIGIYVIYLIILIIAILVVFTDFLRYFLILIVIVCFLLGIFVGLFMLVIQLMIYGILLFLLIWGITYILIGRNDFGKKHKIFVIIGFALALTYFILFILNAILSLVTTQVAMSSILTGGQQLNQNILIMIVLSIILAVIGNLAFLLFAYNLTSKKVLLIIAFILGVLSPFTVQITGIISFLLFMMVYKSTLDDLLSDKKKAKLLVPCPFCNI